MKVIKISAIWCGSCILMNKKYQDLKNKYDLEMEELDYDMDDISIYNVGDKLPVLILADDISKRIIGEKSIEELSTFIEVNK